MPDQLRRQLRDMEGDEAQIRDAFCKDLQFGTSGLRGVMEPGTNRMNIYVVRKISQAIANFIGNRKMDPAVVIGYDSRIFSDVFAQEAAAVFTANGIHVHLFAQIVPVSAVSFAVRKLHCAVGIMITASHNSREYNGYKVYDNKGCQITGFMPKAILQESKKIDIFRHVKWEKPRPQYIDASLMEAYLDVIMKEAHHWERRKMECLKLIYTPLNGAGSFFVPEVLKQLGITDVKIPIAQEKPDGNFPTCPYPNPEKFQVFQEAAKLLTKTEADLIIATDPDCDRVGVAVPDGDKIRVMNGNEIGLILFDFICKMRQKNGTMPKEPVAVRSIVSSPLIDRMAAANHVQVKCTLNGFKHIAAFMEELAEAGTIDNFIFGFEQSNGYLTSTALRDKDGVSIAMLLCQAAVCYKEKNKTLLDALDAIYTQYGYCLDDNLEFCFSGSEAAPAIEKIMEAFRTEGGPLDHTQIHVIDYMTQTRQPLPKDNTLQIICKDGTSFMIRPSGTEPKLKIYIFASGDTYNEAYRKKEELKEALSQSINCIIK